MKTKTLYILIAAAVLALIVAMLMNRSSAPQSDVTEQAKPLLPGLKEHMNDVNGITLTGAGNKTLLTLRRDNDGWVIAEKSNYPVDMTKVREFLLKLSQATLLEQKTSNPKRFAELGVDDVKDNDAKGVLVDLAGLPQPSKLIVGNYNGGGGGGTFVRRDGDAQSWLANENLSVAKNASDWEKRDLADIAATRLRSVTLTSGDGKTLKVYKDQPSDANFKIADVPKGREASSEFAANNLGSVLANLRADDVAAAKDMPPADKPNKAQYTAFDGVHIDATLWQKDNKDYGAIRRESRHGCCQRRHRKGASQGESRLRSGRRRGEKSRGCETRRYQTRCCRSKTGRTAEATGGIGSGRRTVRRDSTH